MNAKRSVRTRSCGADDAKKRIRDAKAYLDQAEFSAGDSSPENQNVAVSSAVMSGIASSDAACCLVLKECSKGESHVAAVELLRTIQHGGAGAARTLGRLVALKTPSQYGFDDIAPSKTPQAIKYARELLAFAEAQLER